MTTGTTVMICCGSGSDFGKVLVPALGLVPDPESILDSFSKRKNCTNLALTMSEAAYFQ
jgi:hypothetical protein